MSEDRYSFDCSCGLPVIWQPLSAIPDHCPVCEAQWEIQWHGKVMKHEGPKEEPEPDSETVAAKEDQLAPDQTATR